MRAKFNRASMLWTGGKDSALALYNAQMIGYDVVNLVTFAPTGKEFLAHPLNIISYKNRNNERRR